MSTKSPSRSVYVVAVLLVLLIVAIGGLDLRYSWLASTSSSTSSSSSTSGGVVEGANVTVFGLVSTTGAGTHPVSLTFVGTGASASARHVAQVASGGFSIQLPNRETYNVSLTWGGNFTSQQGETALPPLFVNMSGGSSLAQSFNQVVLTPDSRISVNGTVPWHALTSNPVSIRFTTSHGENFTAPISADNNAFSIRLPNMMNYEVSIQAQNSTGGLEWFYAHTLQVAGGPNVVGIAVRVQL